MIQLMISLRAVFLGPLRLVVGLALSASTSWSAEPVDFNREIRPLLSDRCFLCHGPDAGQRATDLRLDQSESAHRLAIRPGDASGSELIRRISSEDADIVMPPPDSNLRLSEPEKQLLRRWISEGAKYAVHWAFLAPQRPKVPNVQNTGWPRNELDFFVLKRMEQEKLAPNQAADAETILRRVTFDLTGLPPTVDEMDAFLSDVSQGFDAAYERLVDRLLASEKFGERMAIDWLDVSRYADTYGYQNDRYRAMWPWRDWVVTAFNQNLPYDEFITWQLAGDLLPHATRDQILATAFNRNHRQTNEGGSVEEEFRAEYVADRVNTFGAAFLGLTLECCRCHDHKYDPLTQREYYQLSAFFNNIDESGLYSHFTEATPTPTLLLSSASEERELKQLNQQIADLEGQLARWRPTTEAFDQWRAALQDVRQDFGIAPSSENRLQLSKLLMASLSQSLLGDFPLEEIVDDKVANRVEVTSPAKTSESPTIVAGRVGNAILLDGENNISMKAGSDFDRNQPFTIAFWLKTPQEFERAVVFHRSRAWTDSGSRGYELLIEKGRLSAALVHFWPGNALRIVSREELPSDKWTYVVVRYDGSSQAKGLNLWVDGEPIEVDVVRDSLSRHIIGTAGADGGESGDLTFGQRFRDVGFKGGEIDEIKVFSRDLSDLELRTLYISDSSPANLAEILHNVSPSALQDYYVRCQPETIAMKEELRKLRDRRKQLGDPIAEIMVMREDPVPRRTFILTRGAYDAPGEEVGRGLPASILPTNNQSMVNRLDLARWLVDPQHPLTARVAVNRFWQAIFGIGIVSTSEDFGLQGSAPSHPELLDWLSVEFVESKWNIKHLLKTIVMSATYRQSSNPTRQLLESDPENRLLARGPAIRLTAEMIRDNALSASGLLMDTQGGPPVKPYQPEGLWEEKSGLAYKRDEAAGSHRRSLYTYWKRTSPPPAMMTLDSSNREVCVVRRQVTMTPLQTLVLLNDPQYVEAARALAERALMKIETTNSIAADEKRAQFVFRALTGRSPSQQEIAVLVQLVSEQRKLFSENEAAQLEWLAIGDHRAAAVIDTLELSAWSVLASGLMSFDETVMKR